MAVLFTASSCRRVRSRDIANDDRDCYEHSSHRYLVAKMFSHRTTDAIDSHYS